LPGVDPAIHEAMHQRRTCCKAVARCASSWMRGSSPRMTRRGECLTQPSGSFRQKRAARFPARTPDSHFKQPARPTRKSQSSAAPVSRGAGCAVMGFPHQRMRETSPLTKREGAERRQARGNILTPCGVRPMTLGVRLPALHCGVFLRPRDRLLEADRGPLYGKPLIPRTFTRVHPPPPARCRTDPHSWAGQCLPRPPETSLRGSSAGAASVPPFRRL
jgi:hypothetical protein